MLARKSTLIHPIGDAVVDFPRLVPSFSSVRFPFKRNGSKRKYFSSINETFEQLAMYIKGSFLISAFDLHNGYFNKPEKFFSQSNKDLIFIDSGGYELQYYNNLDDPHFEKIKCEFSQDDYIKVLSKLPKNIPFAITNYDWDTRNYPIDRQIREAQKLFNRFDKYLRNFIIKPPKSPFFQDIDEVVGNIKKLKAFNIIGITEKELGPNIIDRIKTIVKLRRSLDNENIKAPIHVWGGLDPILTPLYFFAGAEIFDGLSWLRYAYHEGISIIRDSYPILTGDCKIEQAHASNTISSKNLSILLNLGSALKGFVDEKGNFKYFNSTRKCLREAYNNLCTEIPELKGGA